MKYYKMVIFICLFSFIFCFFCSCCRKKLSREKTQDEKHGENIVPSVEKKKGSTQENKEPLMYDNNKLEQNNKDSEKKLNLGNFYSMDQHIVQDVLTNFGNCEANIELFKEKHPGLAKKVPEEYLQALKEHKKEGDQEKIELFKRLHECEFDLDKLEQEYPEYKATYRDDNFIDLDGDGDKEFVIRDVLHLTLVDDTEALSIIIYDVDINKETVRNYRENILEFAQGTNRMLYHPKPEGRGQYIVILNKRGIYRTKIVDGRRVGGREFVRTEYKTIILEFTGKELMRVVDIHECKEDYRNCPVCSQILEK